jgi:hypothetical protein
LVVQAASKIKWVSKNESNAQRNVVTGNSYGSISADCDEQATVNGTNKSVSAAAAFEKRGNLSKADVLSDTGFYLSGLVS